MESEFNLALSTLERIDRGIRICNEGLFNANFGLWLKGLYWLYGELSTYMNAKEQVRFLGGTAEGKTINGYLEPCKSWKGNTLQANLDTYLIATQYLRRIAHKNKLLLREKEDTSKHGGA